MVGYIHINCFFSQLSEDFPKKCPLKNHFSCLKKAPGWPCHVMVAASEVRTSSGDLLSWERKGSKVAWLVLQWWTTLPPVECGYHRDIILVYLMGYFFGDIGYCTLYPTGICVKRYNGHTVLLPGMWELWCWFDANPVLNQPRFNEMGAFQTLLRCFFLLCRWTLLFYFHDIPFEAELGPHIPDVISWQVCIRDCKTIFPIFSRSKPNITPRVCAPEIGWRETLQDTTQFYWVLFCPQTHPYNMCIYIYDICVT